MKRLQILFLWIALALSAYAQPTAGGTYQLTKAKWQAILTGTKTASYIVDGSGAARLLTAADIPAHNASAANLTSGAIASAARLSTSGTADSTTFLRGDLTWATPSGGSSNISLSNITSGTLATDLVVGAKNIEFTGAGTGDTAKSLIYADGNAGNVTLQVPSAKTLTVKSGTIAGAVLGNGVYTVGNVNSGGQGGHFYSDSTTARIKNGSQTQFQCFTTGAYIDRSDALYIRTNAGTNKYKLSDTLIETPALSIGGTIGSSTNPSTGGLALTGKFYISTSQTPASSGATGTTGQICWDASYLYVCVNTNTWTRVAIATW